MSCHGTEASTRGCRRGGVCHSVFNRIYAIIKYCIKYIYSIKQSKWQIAQFIRLKLSFSSFKLVCGAPDRRFPCSTNKWTRPGQTWTCVHKKQYFTFSQSINIFLLFANRQRGCGTLLPCWPLKSISNNIASGAYHLSSVEGNMKVFIYILTCWELYTNIEISFYQ